MDIKEQALFLENRHPWETVRYSFFRHVLEDAIPWFHLKSERPALDVGAGDAWFAAQLARDCPALSRIVCWDTAYPITQPDSAPTGKLLKTQSRPEGRFDLILLLDVLEHVENDRDFLSLLVSDNLNDQGYVLISVPAWNSLYSEHDRFLGHHRRYSFRALRNLIAPSGLKIMSQGGAFHSLLFPRALAVAQERFHKTKNPRTVGVAQWEHGPGVTKLVKFLLACDNRASLFFSKTGLAVPGLSGWVICHKQP